MSEHESPDFQFKYWKRDVEAEIVKILESGAKTRAELVKHLEMPRTTVYDYLKKLMNNGIVDKGPMESGKTPRWCPNNKKCESSTYRSSCYWCNDFKLIPGSPPLKKLKGRPKVLYYLVEKEKD